MDVLEFHPTRGMANIHKKDLDKSAAPENAYVRGPVAGMIGTCAKFLRPAATFSSLLS